jgi:hypothetical protein
MPFVTRPVLLDFLARLDAAFAHPGRLYLIGETTHLFEGWRPWTEQVECCAEVTPDDRPAFDQARHDVAADLGIVVLDEAPGDLIPLPDGFDARHRPLDDSPASHLRLFHFDPYSVAYRFIARGDEPDYHLVLAYLDHGWLSFEEMEARLAALLPRFSMETIQQDPAEFRRKYKGLLQMWRAVRPGTTHRP